MQIFLLHGSKNAQLIAYWYLSKMLYATLSTLLCLIVGGSLCNFWNFSPPIAFYNDPPFYQNVKERPTPHFITNPAIIGFSKFLRKQKSFSARQNSFWEQKLIYIFTNCMFTEKKQVFQLRIRTSNSNLLSHHKIIGSSVVNLCVKANIHLWPSILFPPPPF